MAAYHYTTNTIESVNMSLRKITKNRAMFPIDGAVLKLLNIRQKQTTPLQTGKPLSIGLVLCLRIGCLSDN
jgi:transposase-like protein